jgi:ribosomal protein L6P/L9E
MRPILSDRVLKIPEGVTVEVKSRRVTVTGPRGKLQKDLSHICCDIYLIEDEGTRKVKVDCHFRKRKELSSLRTVVSHISNMITGVTAGYRCVISCLTALLERCACAVLCYVVKPRSSPWCMHLRDVCQRINLSVN